MYSQSKTFAVNTTAFGLIGGVLLAAINAMGLATLAFTIACVIGSFGSIVMLIAFVNSPTSFRLDFDHLGALLCHGVVAMFLVANMGNDRLAIAIFAGLTAMSVIWLLHLADKILHGSEEHSTANANRS